MSTANVHPGYRKAAVELRGLAKQASDTVGIFVRLSVYMEINPDHAIAQMQKMAVTEKGNPHLREAAVSVLQMVQPEALQEAVDRKKNRDEERAKHARIHARADELEKEGHPWIKAWGIANAEAKSGKRSAPAKPARDGNVVAVNFGGSS